MRWRAFPLHPETPEAGQLLTELFRTDTARIEQLMAQLQATAAQLGLEFGRRTTTYNSRLAQELGLWAESRGHGQAFHLAAFNAYFAKGKNLALQPVLLELARNAGLAPREALEVLTARSYHDQVDNDWRQASRLGITAVPTFVLAESRLVGAQSYGSLQGLMLEHGIGKRG